MRITTIVIAVSLWALIFDPVVAQEAPKPAPLPPLQQDQANQQQIQRRQQELEQQHEQRLQRHPRPGTPRPGQNPLGEQSAVEGPCRRTEQQITIGGVDQDATNCFESNLGDVIDSLGLQLTAQLKKEAGIRAKFTLMEQDKDDLQNRYDRMMQSLTYYQDYFNSVEPVLEKAAQDKLSESSK
jgi:hypothetical protein